ncbi:MAG: hypothetical protein Kow0029_20050 [Candidatus Rifleibacteriota bacterium]
MRNYVFGPVPSRRLGISLGVDLTPNKTCSYDCLYCQLSKTRLLTSKRDRFCPAQDVIKELKEVLDEIAPPDWITFSGTGEPTLHLDIGLIIREIKKFCSSPVCVITNSSLLHLPEVQNDLLTADKILPTLTTVFEETYKRIHRPTENLTCKTMLRGLKEFSGKFGGEIEIEIFVCPGFNDSDREITGLRNYISSLANIRSIYLNTAVRVPLEGEIITAEPRSLELFKDKLQLDLPVYNAFERQAIPRKASDWRRKATKEDVFKLLMRHPCSVAQLSKVLDSQEETIQGFLQELLEQKKVKQLKNKEWTIVEA